MSVCLCLPVCVCRCAWVYMSLYESISLYLCTCIQALLLVQDGRQIPKPSTLNPQPYRPYYWYKMVDKYLPNQVAHRLHPHRLPPSPPPTLTASHPHRLPPSPPPTLTASHPKKAFVSLSHLSLKKGSRIHFAPALSWTVNYFFFNYYW
jgi:hypothetical protein